MPLYEYECTSCRRRTEKIQKYSDADLTVCPHCGGPLERTITAAAMVFKGGGWYKDGYASVKHDDHKSGSESNDFKASSDVGATGDAGSSSAESTGSGSSDSGSSGDSAKLVPTPTPANSTSSTTPTPAPAPSSPAKAQA